MFNEYPKHVTVGGETRVAQSAEEEQAILAAVDPVEEPAVETEPQESQTGGE